MLNQCKMNYVKFLYSEMATKFCEISTLLLSLCTVDKNKVEDFAKFCGLLRNLITFIVRDKHKIFLSKSVAVFIKALINMHSGPDVRLDFLPLFPRNPSI